MAAATGRKASFRVSGQRSERWRSRRREERDQQRDGQQSTHSDTTSIAIGCEFPCQRIVKRRHIVSFANIFCRHTCHLLSLPGIASYITLDELEALKRKQLARASEPVMPAARKAVRVPTTATAKSAPSATPFVPEERSLPVLASAVQKCRGCDLYRNATQAIFGEIETGSKAAKPRVAIMMIGEQPGDKEDLEGHPFVGPAGKLLDECLEEAGIDRGKVYVTNAVKHFKWEPRGKRRIHEKPSAREVRACRPWLDAEIETVRPKLLVALGATAAQSLLGTGFRLTQKHGEPQQIEGLPPVVATLHPSAVLRAITPEDRRAQRQMLVSDLLAVAKLAA